MNLIFNILLFILLADSYLYWQHRILHKFFMKQHAIHHKYKFKIVMHPLEHFLNWGIFLIGWILGFSFLQMLPVAIWGITYTFLAHAEKKSINSPGIFMRSIDHEIHHGHYSKCFGVLFSFWDRIMGTYE